MDYREAKLTAYAVVASAVFPTAIFAGTGSWLLGVVSFVLVAGAFWYLLDGVVEGSEGDVQFEVDDQAAYVAFVLGGVTFVGALMWWDSVVLALAYAVVAGAVAYHGARSAARV